jgi:hypothetical protein
MPAGRGSCRGPAGRARARQRSRRTAAGRAMRTPGGGSHRDGPRARPALGAGAAGRARARARRRARAGHSSPAPPKGRVTGRPPAKVRAGSDGQVTTRIVWQSSRPLSSTSSSADCSPASRVRSAIATAEVKAGRPRVEAVFGQRGPQRVQLGSDARERIRVAGDLDQDELAAVGAERREQRHEAGAERDDRPPGRLCGSGRRGGFSGNSGGGSARAGVRVPPPGASPAAAVRRKRFRSGSSPLQRLPRLNPTCPKALPQLGARFDGRAVGSGGTVFHDLQEVSR